ncbi:MAG: hypothetical protein ACLQVI_18105 [Polyangiaceae bacterium]
MAPPKALELDDQDVLHSVVLFVALARRWLVTRDPEVGALIAPIVAAARTDARDRDESFVAALHDDLTALYRDFQQGDPGTAEARGKELRNLFERHSMSLDDDQLTVLDATPDEIKAGHGPADTARTNLASLLGIAGRTIQNYRQRLGMIPPPRTSDLDTLLAHPFRPPETRVSPIFTYRWRETLRAARAVHFILVHFLDETPSTARTLLMTRRRGRRPL